MMITDLLIGAWGLCSCRSFTADRRELPDSLAKAQGVIFYQDCGMMSAQIICPALMINQDEYKDYPIQPPFDTIPDAIARLSLENFLSYYGTYQLDRSQQLVRHYIQGSNLPHYIYQTLCRHYQFMDDDNLILETRLGEKSAQVELFYRQLHWRRIMHRKEV